MSQVAIIKLPKGQTPPLGFEQVRELRNAIIYHKIIPVVNKDDMDELTNMFQNNLNVALIPITQEEDFLNQITNQVNSMNIGGKSRKRYLKRIKNKKTKKSRKHSHKHSHKH